MSLDANKVQMTQEKYYKCMDNPGCSQQQQYSYRREYSEAELDQMVGLVPIAGSIFSLAKDLIPSVHNFWEREIDFYELQKYGPKRTGGYVLSSQISSGWQYYYYSGGGYGGGEGGSWGGRPANGNKSLLKCCSS